MDEKIKKFLEEISSLSEMQDDVWPEDRHIDGLKLVCTCMACPEQYDVFDSSGNKVGYLRLRHGTFRADFPDCGGETVYRSSTLGDGTFDDAERDVELGRAIAAIKKKLSP